MTFTDPTPRPGGRLLDRIRDARAARRLDREQRQLDRRLYPSWGESEHR